MSHSSAEPRTFSREVTCYRRLFHNAHLTHFAFCPVRLDSTFCSHFSPCPSLLLSCPVRSSVSGYVRFWDFLIAFSTSCLPYPVSCSSECLHGSECFLLCWNLLRTSRIKKRFLIPRAFSSYGFSDLSLTYTVSRIPTPCILLNLLLLPGVSLFVFSALPLLWRFHFPAPTFPDYKLCLSSRSSTSPCLVLSLPPPPTYSCFFQQLLPVEYCFLFLHFLFPVSPRALYYHVTATFVMLLLFIRRICQDLFQNSFFYFPSWWLLIHCCSRFISFWYYVHVMQSNRSPLSTHAWTTLACVVLVRVEHFSWFLTLNHRPPPLPNLFFKSAAPAQQSNILIFSFPLCRSLISPYLCCSCFQISPLFSSLLILLRPSLLSSPLW